jgi:3-phosphoshikimate 1-carboxyvinyltransferase
VPLEVKAEGDWSAASYWFQIVALGDKEGQVILKGLDRYSLQGDSAVAGLFNQLGVKHKFSPKGLVLSHSGAKISRFKYDFTSQPDLAQTFAVTCACLGIPFHLTGLHTLKIKETDRISALIAESRKLGFVFTTNNVDDLRWDGVTGEVAEGPVISTYHDHRMAMAFAPASLTRGSFSIAHPDVVSKSYPRYWEDLKEAGFFINK